MSAALGAILSSWPTAIIVLHPSVIDFVGSVPQSNSPRPVPLIYHHGR